MQPVHVARGWLGYHFVPGLLHSWSAPSLLQKIKTPEQLRCNLSDPSCKTGSWILQQWPQTTQSFSHPDRLEGYYSSRILSTTYTGVPGLCDMLSSGPHCQRWRGWSLKTLCQPSQAPKLHNHRHYTVESMAT